MLQTPCCLYCGESAFEPFLTHVTDRLRFVPGVWEYRRCRQCGSARLFPFPSPEELIRFYPPGYGFPSGWEYRLFFQPQSFLQARRILRLVGNGHGNGQRRLLDIGCGAGLQLLALRQAGFEVFGSDFRADSGELLARRFKIPVVSCDADSVAQHFPAESFDVVTAFHLLEHVPDIQAVLENCLTLLRPGGWLVATTPLMGCLQVSLFHSQWAGASEAPRHLSLPSLQGIRVLLNRVGFELTRTGPDGLLNCAGVATLSLVPALGRRHFGCRGPLHSIRSGFLSLTGASVGLCLLPLCWMENYILRRPAHGMVVAHRPMAVS